MTTDMKPEALAIPTEAFLLFDKQDDLAVVARLRGAVLKEYVYAFRQGGQMIYGLGVDGAEACKRELARMGEVIREDEIDLIREDTERAYFRAKASRWAVKPGQPDVKLDTSVELKNQKKYITKRDGTLEPNEFWFEQGGSKAMRNAILNLVPETIKQQIIESYKKSARIVDPTPEQADAMTQEYHASMKDKDELDALVSEIVDLWRALAWTRAQVKTCLRERGLSEALADPKVSWANVDLATITDLRDAMKTQAGK
jgi:hypothetical protein